MTKLFADVSIYASDYTLFVKDSPGTSN